MLLLFLLPSSNSQRMNNSTSYKKRKLYIWDVCLTLLLRWKKNYIRYVMGQNDFQRLNTHTNSKRQLKTLNLCHCLSEKAIRINICIQVHDPKWGKQKKIHRPKERLNRIPVRISLMWKWVTLTHNITGGLNNTFKQAKLFGEFGNLLNETYF